MDDDASKWRPSAYYELKTFTESRETVWETKKHMRLKRRRCTYYKFTRQGRVSSRYSRFYPTLRLQLANWSSDTLARKFTRSPLEYARDYPGGNNCVCLLTKTRLPLPLFPAAKLSPPRYKPRYSFLPI
jgi:hypothetical protein